MVSTSIAEPTPDEVVVRIEAAPINPLDQGLMFGAADMSAARQSGTGHGAIVTASIPQARVRSMAGRLGECGAWPVGSTKSMPVGNEGAGVVVSTGASAKAQALLGRTVAVFGGGTYAQYRRIRVEQCLALPDGTNPAQAASCFINPLTALGMVESIATSA